MKHKIISLWGEYVSKCKTLKQSGLDETVINPKVGKPNFFDLSGLISLSKTQTTPPFGAVLTQLGEYFGEDHDLSQTQELHVTAFLHFGYQTMPPEAETDPTEFIKSSLHSGRELFNYLKNQRLSPWELTFHEIILLKDSVIAVAYDGGRMNQLRRELVAHGISREFYDVSRREKIYPDIVHATLMRFKTDVPLEKRQGFYSWLATQYTEPYRFVVDNISLRRVPIYGRYLSTEVIDEIDLK